jgi:hypothetical protein
VIAEHVAAEVESTVPGSVDAELQEILGDMLLPHWQTKRLVKG